MPLISGAFRDYPPVQRFPFIINDILKHGVEEFRALYHISHIKASRHPREKKKKRTPGSPKPGRNPGKHRSGLLMRPPPEGREKRFCSHSRTETDPERFPRADPRRRLKRSGIQPSQNRRYSEQRPSVSRWKSWVPCSGYLLSGGNERGRGRQVKGKNQCLERQQFGDTPSHCLKDREKEF